MHKKDRVGNINNKNLNMCLSWRIPVVLVDQSKLGVKTGNGGRIPFSICMKAIRKMRVRNNYETYKMIVGNFSFKLQHPKS